MDAGARFSQIQALRDSGEVRILGTGGCSFLRAAIMKYHELGDLKQQKCMLSQVWRLEVQNPGVGRARLPL